MKKVGQNPNLPNLQPLKEEKKEAKTGSVEQQQPSAAVTFQQQTRQSQFETWPPVDQRQSGSSNGHHRTVTQPKTNAAMLSRMQAIGQKKVAQQAKAEDPKLTTQGAADRLHKAMKGWGTNEKEILRVLSNRSTEEINMIRDDFKAKHGGDLDSWIKSELGGDDLKKAQLMLKGSDIPPATRDTEMLRVAMDGVGTDEKAILDTLYGKSPRELELIQAEYKDQTGRSLEDALKSELSGDDQIRALATLRQGRIRPEDELRAAMDGMGTNEASIFRTLEGKTPEQLAEIKTNYQKQYGRDLTQDLKSELSDGDEVKALTLLENGKISDADTLKQAMAGFGTQEKTIQDVFKGKSPEELATLREEYGQKYGDLEKDIRSEMSGSELDETLSLLQHGKLSTAEEINKAVRGFGTDEMSIMKTLDGLSPEQLATAKAEYQEKYGRTLESELRSEMSGQDLEKALLLSKNGTLDLAERVHFASTGLGTDEQALFQALEKASPEERANLEANYKAKYGGSALSKIKSELSGADQTKALYLLEHGSLSLEQSLDVAMSGVGTREQDIFDALGKAKPEERKAIQSNPAMMQRLRSELGGNDLERAELLLQNGSLTREQQLHFAMDRLGTDEAAVHKALEGLSPQERLQVQENYKAAYGKDLMTDLKAELGSRDIWQAEDALAQPPQTMRERLDRAEIRASRERHHGSPAANASDTVMDAFSDTGFRIDNELRELKAIAQGAQRGDITMLQADKAMSASETKLDQLTAEYQAEKDSVADTVGNIATVSVAAAATAATGGLAALPAAALVAASAGATKAATHKLLVGNSYDMVGMDGAKDFLTGAGEGLAFYGGGKAVDAVSSAVGKRVLLAQGKNVTEKGLMLMGRQALRESGGKVTMATVERAASGVLRKAGEDWMAQTLTRKVLTGALQGAAKGGLYSGVTAGAQTLSQDETWDMEFTDAVQKVLSDSGSAALQGAKGWAIGTGTLKFGEHLSQSIIGKIQMNMGRKMFANRTFSDREILKAASEALGDNARALGRETLMQAGRDKLAFDLGRHFMDSTVRGQAMKITLENVLSRGIAAQPRVLINNIGNQEMWANGFGGALEEMWSSSSSATLQDATKFGSKDVAMKMAQRMKMVRSGGASEALLANVVSRSVGAGL
ncbi:MAG: hypothetical protein EP343_10570 [Deltaproteobacteria bacterium]|nr:MAG: hypothetical protein EP343_10570 [Deltaproteobacteria bacterium]